MPITNGILNSEAIFKFACEDSGVEKSITTWDFSNTFFESAVKIKSVSIPRILPIDFPKLTLLGFSKPPANSISALLRIYLTNSLPILPKQPDMPIFILFIKTTYTLIT